MVIFTIYSFVVEIPIVPLIQLWYDGTSAAYSYASDLVVMLPLPAVVYEVPLDAVIVSEVEIVE